jgi:dienelactone hydrolase
MRPFENLLVAIAFIGSVLILTSAPVLDVHTHPAMAANFLVLLTALFVLHAAREGIRWQMIPAYLALGLLGTVVFLSAIGQSPIYQWLAGTGILCIAVSGVFRWVLPMFRFAQTTGPYKTGTSIHYLADTTRTEEDGRHREMMVQLWYPAQTSKRRFACYRRREETTHISSYQGLLKTRSRLDAPLALAEGPFPVLLFNPSWNGRRTQNTFLTQELASYGFVVAAIDHTYNSEPVAFPDGRVVMAHHVRAMEDVSTSTAEEVQRIGNAEVDRQVLDDRFVLDELTRWNLEKGSEWYQRLGTERAGALGHSLGGAVAVECWATDQRVIAAMNMDGWTFGAQAATGQRKEFPESEHTTSPLLFLYEENHNPFNDVEIAAASGKPQVEQQVDAWDAAHIQQLLEVYGGYRFKIHGANHVNFTDRAITSPLRKLAGGGSIDPRRAHRIVRDYAVQFFVQALRGQQSALLEGDDVSRYTEVVRLPHA